jgi:hypothetical protein
LRNEGESAPTENKRKQIENGAEKENADGDV